MVDLGGIAITRCEYVTVLVPDVVPPPTFTPLANVPTTPPTPNASATAPKFTPAPPLLLEDVVVEEGTYNGSELPLRVMNEFPISIKSVRSDTFFRVIKIVGS